MKRNQIVVLLIVAASVIGWALFRPERLFVNAKVNESLPSTASTTNVCRNNSGNGQLSWRRPQRHRTSQHLPTRRWQAYSALHQL